MRSTALKGNFATKGNANADALTRIGGKRRHHPFTLSEARRAESKGVIAMASASTSSATQAERWSLIAVRPKAESKGKSGMSDRACRSLSLKPFYLYILRCNDGSLYIGHTDDIERRMEQHGARYEGSYTGRLGVTELVWFDEMPSREEAIARERQIKRWTRKKKEALIAGDWARVKGLSRCYKQHGRPSE